ncbi:MAG: hypothetical protein P8Y93_06070 [Acidobacteriota bacterium]
MDLAPVAELYRLLGALLGDQQKGLERHRLGDGVGGCVDAEKLGRHRPGHRLEPPTPGRDLGVKPSMEHEAVRAAAIGRHRGRHVHHIRHLHRVLCRLDVNREVMVDGVGCESRCGDPQNNGDAQEYRPSHIGPPRPAFYSAPRECAREGSS